jgi:site-specific DNA-cytosine methylase
VRVGSDCSGIETILHALKVIDVDFRHVFSCDTLKQSKAAIRYNFGKRFKWYSDIMARPAKDTPDMDLYHAGFPCQPYSQAYNRRLLISVGFPIRDILLPGGQPRRPGGNI